MTTSQVVASVSPAAGVTNVTQSDTPALLATSSLSQESNLPQQGSSSYAFSEVRSPLNEVMASTFHTPCVTANLHVG